MVSDHFQYALLCPTSDHRNFQAHGNDGEWWRGVGTGKWEFLESCNGERGMCDGKFPLKPVPLISKLRIQCTAFC